MFYKNLTNVKETPLFEQVVISHSYMKTLGKFVFYVILQYGAQGIGLKLTFSIKYTILRFNN